MADVVCLCVVVVVSLFSLRGTTSSVERSLLFSSPSLAPSEGKKREPGNEFEETEENSHCSRN